MSSRGTSLAFMTGSVSSGVHHVQRTRGPLDQDAALLLNEILEGRNLTDAGTEQISELIDSIENLIKRLQTSVSSDDGHDEWCKSEWAKINARGGDLDALNGTNSLKMEQEQASISTLEGEVKQEEQKGLEEAAQHEADSADSDRQIAEA